MCNRYISPETAEAERFWRIDERRSRRPLLGPLTVFPRSQAPFIRRAKDETGYERELVVGQWGLIPWFAKKPELTYSTNNARGEEVEAKASYKDPWKRGQRCIIPAASFDEPNWESGKNQWWAFRRPDGDPWGLAGLWNTWTDKETGEVHESYTMLTLNANAHPLMNRMHKPEVDKVTKKPLPFEQQDKRSVIVIEAEDVDLWLAGTTAEAKQLLKLAPVEAFSAGPAGAAAAEE
ncbi:MULTISPECIES: SOS response-associated peptidase [unclassified Variovorax]|uniref:SOS response-associated peptidase n=1 Tax=unclassified Variovorax TaxID=663243 RepID=UPI003F45428B